MIPLRTQVKFFLENPAGVDLAVFGGVFQRWIQQSALNDMLIDVADYRHVFEGPGIVLIGHYSEYALESRGGQLGLLYTRKRQSDADLQGALRTSFQLAIAAAELLETEAAFEPRLKFRADAVEIRFADRLSIPNRPESFDLVKADLGAVLAELYGKPVDFAPVTHDARNVFTVNVHADGAGSFAETFQHLKTGA
jgi:hypothetical protein